MTIPPRPRALALLLPFVLTACGGEHAPAPGRAAATAWRPQVEFGAELGPARPERATLSLTPTAAIEPWTTTGGDVRFAPVELPQAPDAPALQVDSMDGATVSVPGPFDLDGFNRVRVTMLTAPGATVELGLRSDGELVARSEPMLHPLSLRPETLEAVFVVGDDEVDEVVEVDEVDEVVVRVGRASGSLNVYGIQLVRENPREWLPTPEEPGVVFIGEDGRSAVGLPVDSTLEFELADDAGEELHFVRGALPEHWSAAGDATFRVTVEDDAGQTRGFERTGAALEAGAWRRERLDLRGLGTGRVGTFALVGGSHTGACALAVGEVLVRGTAPSPPTVLLITSDTHRADHLGASGSGVAVATPHLDALAARGVLFERAFSTSCITVPSHAALLTGRHPIETGVYTNASLLPEAFGTLAERFAAAGYATFGATSARHVSHDYTGLGRGFDRYSAPLLSISRPADETRAVLEEWLAEVEDLPVFVWLHVFDAHGPYVPPEPFGVEYVAAARGEGPDAVQRARYRGEVDWVDHVLGGVLERSRFAEGVVAVTADHGESLGAHGIAFAHEALYPDTIHVPLIVAWPGSPAGERVTRRVRQMDVGRTLLALAELEHDDFPGRVLIEPADEVVGPLYALDSNGRSAAITDGDLHLILSLTDHYLLPRDRGPFIDRHATELYDLATDPDAETDLVDTRPQDARRLRARLVDWLDAAPPRPTVVGGAAERSSALLADLAALGYSEVDEGPAGEPWIDPDCDCAHCARWD